jgi:flagellar assembly factor FliW
METTTPLLTVTTAHLGEVQVPAAEVLQFVAPLAPFGGVARYVLLPAAPDSPFWWLQAVDTPAPAVVVARYEELTGEPAPPPRPEVAAELGLAPDEPAEVYVIVAVGPSAPETTMNLLAPVYVGRGSRRARQVILDGDLGRARVPVLAA